MLHKYFIIFLQIQLIKIKPKLIMIAHILRYSILMLVLSTTTVFAQISGTKTIGGASADYATFSAAVAALNSSGINGAVVFNVAAGTYTEQFALASITGSSATNTITFQSANGDSTSVVIDYAASNSATNNYVVQLNGTSNIVFKGLTIKRTGSGSHAIVIRIIGASNYVGLKNNVIKNDITGSTLTATTLVYAPNGTGNVHSNHSYLNNRFVNGAVAIYNFGVGSNTLCDNTLIEDNEFVNQGKHAMLLYYQNAPNIIHNTINTSSASSSSYEALKGNYVKNAFVFMNNKLALSKGVGVNLQLSSGNSATGLITNNFIYIAGPGKGIFLNNTGHQNIYFNSIRMGSISSVGVKVLGSGSTAIRFKNNIVLVTANANCFEVSNTNSAFLELDYNNYSFPAGSMGKYNSSTTILTLSAWKTATGKDANSLNEIVNFVSSSDMHVVSSNIALQGTSANTSPFINTDIDGQTRNSLTPDIGADEFSISDVAVDSIHLETAMCFGNQYTLTVDIKNTGTVTLTSINVPVAYTMVIGGAIQVGVAQIASLAPGAVFAYTPTNKIPGTPLGQYTFMLAIDMANDADTTNNFDTLHVAISDYPVSNLPNDTTVCAGKTVVLDPGAGYDSYLWYDNSTAQTFSIDSTGIGYGGKFVSVIIVNDGCSIMDSTLVLFKNCTGIESVEMAKSLLLYPNPAQDRISISNKTDFPIQKIAIYHLNGQLVRQIEGAMLNEINVSDLAIGVYYLRLQSEQGVAVKKFIKE